MQLKRYTDYSLRLLIMLALEPERIISIKEVAQTYDISRNHLLKIVTQLHQLKLIRTHRGKKGGLQLGRDPQSINVGKLVRELEGRQALINCKDPACPILPACRLKTALAEAEAAFYSVLEAYSLADLLDGKETALRRLLATG